MPTFTVIRGESVIEDTVFDVDPITDTSNPFGNFAVVKMDDRGGNLFAEYQRGTRIDISVDPEDNTLTISSGETVTTDAGTTDTYSTVNNAGTYSNQGTVTAGTGTIDGRFTGYVVEPRETEQSGADVLEVEAYSFDQFLRRNTVSNDQSGNTITEALQDIITTDTPVSYVSGNVTVGDEQSLTRSYRGEPVENVLRDLSFKSVNEGFGVNDSLEFFFRPRESTHIDRGIDDTQWFNYDIPELGKEAVNEVEVWYNDGNESVIVDDSTDKLTLQDSLNLPDPGTQRAELQRPLITDPSDAEDIGRKYLKLRNATLSGTVTTYGLFDAQPGDTIDVTIRPRGIDTEFIIAATEYRWGSDQTILTIVENRGDVDDILAEINDSVQRQEMLGADRDAASNRITTTNATGIVSISADADGATPDGDKLVNDGRRAVRDGWSNDGVPDITTLVVGSDGSALSRSNTALGNQTNSASVSQTLPDAKTVEFSASITQTGVQEIGLEAADGTLIMRAVFETAVDLSGTVTITLTVSNDGGVEYGVLTNDGQTAVRDILADNAPTLPADHAYGSDGTAVSESDTALGNELISVSLGDIQVQTADTTSEWDSITSIGATDPVETVNSTLALLQSSFFFEVETDFFTGNSVLDSNASDGEAELYFSTSQNESASFTVDYDIPSSDIDFAIRLRSPNNADVEIDVFIDGTQVTRLTQGNYETSYEWFVTSIGGQTGDITAGSHTVELDVIQEDPDGDEVYLDCLSVLDGRFTYTFDNTVDANGYLDGPELYPDSSVVDLSGVTLQQPADEAEFTSTWNNVDNNQYVKISNDGGSTYQRVSNAQSGSVSFATESKSLVSRLSLSRYSDGTQATPLTGNAGQTVDVWTLTSIFDGVRPDNIGEALARGIVSAGTITGSTVRESGIKGDGLLLSRHVLAEFTVLEGQRVSSSETSLFSSDN